MIFVTVGSRNYPFDRLFKKLDEIYENGTITNEVFAQTGTSSYVPKHFDSTPFVSQSEFQNLIESADIVISHGASGSIMKALNAEKKVIVVTRLEKYGEHIDDHQIQNNEAFAMNDYVLMADVELSDLCECIEKMNQDQVSLKRWKNHDKHSIHKIIDEYISEVWD